MASVTEFDLALDDEKIGTFFTMQFCGTKTWGKYHGYKIFVTFNEDMDRFSDTDILDLRVSRKSKELWLSQVFKAMSSR